MKIAGFSRLTRRQSPRRLVLATLLHGFCLFPVAVGGAGEVGTRLPGETTGALHVMAFLSPSPARVGPTELSVLVRQEGVALAELDLVVQAKTVGRRIDAVPQPGGGLGGTLFEAHLPLSQAGRWTIEVAAKSRDGLSGRLVSEIEVAVASPSVLVWALGLLGVAAALAAFKRALGRPVVRTQST